ncbi:MAG: hypothetical protein RMY34_34030 [Aulosira sp. DedQUE10]|nr:hypothetical protein [Aulosira sp. DedQUE10]
MKIIEQTATTLKFQEHNRQWLWGVLFSIPFVAVGFGIAIITSNITTLECQRTETSKIICQRTIVGLPGTEKTLIPQQITRVYVRIEHGIGVVLTTANNQEVELVNHRIIVREKQRRIANSINTFIKNPQQSRLKIQQDDRWEGFFNGMIFFLPGIAVILQSLAIPTQILCNFDKISGQMTLEKQYQLFGTFTTQQKLTEIQQAQVTQLAVSTRTPLYLVQLELTLTKPISLSPPTRDRQEYQTIVNAINQFLRLGR